MLAGAAAAQAILAALVRRGITGEGAHVETSLLEALMDCQAEALAPCLGGGPVPPGREAVAPPPAPWGVHATADGHLALTAAPIPLLRRVLDLPALDAFSDPGTWRDSREEILAILARVFAARPTAHWLSILQPAGIGCAEVLDWPGLRASGGFAALDMVQRVEREDGVSLDTTRAPLVIDGVRPRAARAAPRIGEDSARIRREFGL